MLCSSERPGSMPPFASARASAGGRPSRLGVDQTPGKLYHETARRSTICPPVDRPDRATLPPHEQRGALRPARMMVASVAAVTQNLRGASNQSSSQVSERCRTDQSGVLTTSGRAAVNGFTPAVFVTRRPLLDMVVTSTSTRSAAAVATWTGITFCEQ